MPKKYIHHTLRNLILGPEDPKFSFPTIIIPKYLLDKWSKDADIALETQLYAPQHHEFMWIRIWRYVKEQRTRMIQEMEWEE